MSERDIWHASIKAQPEDNTIRLAYADWLSEFGEGDLDAARADFIRLSCLGRKRQETRTGKWLDGNWQRLLPGVVGMSLPDARVGYGRTGRTAEISIPFFRGRDPRDPTQTPAPVFRMSTVVEFWRGFAERFVIHSAKSFLFFAGRMRQDDPLAEPHWLAPFFPVAPSRNSLVFRREIWGPLWNYLRVDSRDPGKDDETSTLAVPVLPSEDYSQVGEEIITAASLRYMDAHPDEVWWGTPAGKWVQVEPPLYTLES